MASDFQKFIGGSPGAVLVKLVFLSLLVGAFMAFLGLTPGSLVEGFVSWVRGILELGFAAIGDIGRWLVYGAMIVVPVWFVLRLMRARS